MVLLFQIQEFKKARTWRGGDINEWLDVLKTTSATGTNALQLQQVITGDEPRVFTFEVPISWDRLHGDKNQPGAVYGGIDLCVDDDSHLIGAGDKAADGNCVNRWFTEGYSAGPHRVYAQLMFGMGPHLRARGRR